VLPYGSRLNTFQNFCTSVDPANFPDYLRNQDVGDILNDRGRDPNNLEERIMKKIITIIAATLLMLSSHVFAEDHAKAALEHAKSAVEHGQAGHPKVLTEHAEAALEHALAGALVTKGVQKNHLQEGANALEEAINHANLGHTEDATKHAEAALMHIKAANQ
jgi:hypothetical protein